MAMKICVLIALTAVIQMASTAYSSYSQPPTSSFATNLFQEISKTKTNENVIISPLSIQSALAMTFLGAEGKTAEELVQGLYLPSSDKDEVGKSFSKILREQSGDAEVNIANRIFVSHIYQLKPSFNERALKYFDSEAERLNFGRSLKAIKIINTWVKRQTHDKITDIMQPGSVNGDTSAVIVNAIYFKGLWKLPFTKDATRKRAFWVSRSSSVEVDTMYGDEAFSFGQFPELDATAIEMQYKDSDLSMLIILPKEIDGLAALEEKLRTYDINTVSSFLKRSRDIKVYLPKFRIEFETELNGVLKAMGIRSIFENNADLSGIFESGQPVKVDDVRHKAYIDVNEAGSEAAAATVIKIVPMSMNLDQKIFKADHPFVFAIKSPTTVYFMGHVANFN